MYYFVHKSTWLRVDLIFCCLTHLNGGITVASFPFKLVNLSPSILYLAHLQRCWVFDPVNVLLTSKFSYLVFRNLSDKTKIGIANRWGTTNSKPPGPILWWTNQKHWTIVRSYLLHSFLQVHSVVAPFTNPSNCTIMLSQNDLPEPNRHVLTFLHRILLWTITYWAPLEMLPCAQALHLPRLSFCHLWIC